MIHAQRTTATATVGGNLMDEHATYENLTLASRWTWRDRLRWKLFPVRSHECHPPEGDFTDCIIMEVRSSLSLMDRLRFLFSGRLQMRAYIATEHVVGATKSNTVVWVDCPAWAEREE